MYWGYQIRLTKTGQRGLAAFDFRSIWVNDYGHRFTPEFGDENINLHALLLQPNRNCWSILDSDGRSSFSITLAGWGNPTEVDRLVFETPGVAISASSLEDLSRKIGASPDALPMTVHRYNRFVSGGCRGIDRTGKPIPGLYAVGEATGELCALANVSQSIS